MGVQAEHLYEGGRVFYRWEIPRPGAVSEVRLKPARVLDVERGAATILCADEKWKRRVKFVHLEPDHEYLATLQAKKTVQLNNVRDLHGPEAANEQTTTPEEPPTPPPESPVLVSSRLEASDTIHDDLKAYIDMGAALRAQLDKKIVTAPPTEVGELMTQRKQLDTQIAGAKETMAKGYKVNRTDKATIEAGVADLRAGMTRQEVAAKYDVPYGTTGHWSKLARGVYVSQAKPKPGKAKSKPKATASTTTTIKVAPAPRPAKTARKATKKAPRSPEEPGTALALRPRGAEDPNHVNKRLRALLGVLLERVDPEDVEAQNSQLQRVIDAVLGLE